VVEFAGLVELGIRAGVFPEADDRYEGLAVLMSEVRNDESWIGASLPDRFLAREGASSKFDKDVPQIFFFATRQVPIEYGLPLFESVRRALDFFQDFHGRIAVALCLGKRVTWQSLDHLQTVELTIDGLVTGLQFMARHSQSAPALDSDELAGWLGSLDVALPVPPGLCLLALESFTCLQESGALSDYVPPPAFSSALNLERESVVLPDDSEPAQVDLYEAASELVQKLVTEGQPDDVRDGFQRFYSAISQSVISARAEEA
jgi:hypothetical protein